MGDEITKPAEKTSKKKSFWHFNLFELPDTPKREPSEKLVKARSAFLDAMENNPKAQKEVADLVMGIGGVLFGDAIHQHEMKKELRKAEILPIKAQNAYYENLIKGATAEQELIEEAGKIRNSRLKAEVDTIMSSNSITQTQARLLNKVILEFNFESIEPSQALDLIRSIILKVRDDADLVMEEKKAIEALERTKADTRRANAEARSEEVKADMAELARDETRKRYGQ